MIADINAAELTPPLRPEAILNAAQELERALGIPDWSSVNSSFRSSRGLGNAQALGFNQSASASLFGATTDQEGMGQAVFGPPTIVSGEEFGTGVATVQIKALRSRLSTGQSNRTAEDPYAALLAKFGDTSSSNKNDPTKFGALSSEFGPGDKEANRSAPSDPQKFGSVGYAVTGNGSIVDLSI